MRRRNQRAISGERSRTPIAAAPTCPALNSTRLKTKMATEPSSWVVNISIAMLMSIYTMIQLFWAMNKEQTIG